MFDYRRAQVRHAEVRRVAYAAARDDAIGAGLASSALHLADIDARALRAWRATWTGRHPDGRGGWDWESAIERRPRRSAVLPAAVWWGDDLCGLVLGHASPHRSDGRRHTITLSYVERRPEPPPVPLRGLIVPLAVAVGRNYGRAVGASRLRLRDPDPGVVGYYERLGFRIVWTGPRVAYCEQEI